MDYSKLICHRIPERCFKINNNPMHLCTRCFGFYIGVVFGLIISISISLANILTKSSVIILVIIFSSPLIIDGTTQMLNFRKSDNRLRLITGLSSGFVCGIGIHYLLI